jgi:hypothetical protein
MVKFKKMVGLFLLTFFVGKGLYLIRDGYLITINGIQTELGRVLAINKFISEFPELLHSFAGPIGNMGCLFLRVCGILRGI